MADKKKPDVSEGTKAPVKFAGTPQAYTPPPPAPEPVPPPSKEYPPSLVGPFTPFNALSVRQPTSFVRDPPAPVYTGPVSAPVGSPDAPKWSPAEWASGPKVNPIQDVKYRQMEDLYDRMQDATQTDENRDFGIDIKHSEESRAAAAQLRDMAKRDLEFVQSAQKAGKDPSEFVPMPGDLLPYPNPTTDQQVEVNRRAYEEEVKAAINRLQHYATLEPTDREVVRPRTKKARGGK